MAKITKVNQHLNTPAKRNMAIDRFVIQSSAIEGIKVTDEGLKLPARVSAVNDQKLSVEFNK